MSYNKSKNILISDKIKDNNLIVLDNFDINKIEDILEDKHDTEIFNMIYK